MSDPFWDPIYKKCQQNFELLKLICFDTSDKKMISWVVPNPKLFNLCKPFFHKKKITYRKSFIDRVIEYSKIDEALRKIIFLTWIQDNTATMKFPPLPIDNNAMTRLETGDFGTYHKIKILSYIDPRDGAAQTYIDYLEKNMPETDISEELDASQPITINSNEQEIIKLNKKQTQLEKEIKSLKLDLKKCNRDLKRTSENEKKAKRTITQKSNALKTAEIEIKSLEQENKSLQIKLNSTKNNIKTENVKTAPIAHDNSNNNAEKRKILEDEIIHLQKALLNREKTIERLTSENNNLKAIKIDNSNKDKQISRLQLLLNKNESKSELIDVYGQVRCLTTPESNSENWFFYAYSGDIYRISSKITKRASVIDSEFCRLSLTENGNKPKHLTSLEHGHKYEVIGIIEKKNEMYYLTNENEQVEICCISQNLHCGLPVKGIVLTTFGDRKEGIYKLEELSTIDNINEDIKVASLNQILNFLKVKMTGSITDFREILLNLNIEYSCDENNIFHFNNDYRKLFTCLKGQLPIHIVCSSCIKQAKESNQYILSSLPNHSVNCEICNTPLVADKYDTKEIYNFHGCKILIIGGDRIGSSYEVGLSKHNVQVRWISGFKNLNSLRSGLGKLDAVVVILKQLSHTVLRELVPLAEKEKIKLLYCNRRGISGVLDCLKRSLPFN